MALPGFKGTTYEVLTGDGTRWIIAEIFRAETEARGLADKLLAGGRHPMVRITARRDGWVTEKVIFEAAAPVSAKIIKPYAIASAPCCETPEDCLRHAARLAIGRLGRAYLDERGITAAEFLVSPGDLAAVERRDGFFLNAIHLLAKAQAGATAKSAADRAEILFELHERLRKQARDDTDEGEKLRLAVAKRGLAVLPIGALDEVPTFGVLACMAAILGEGGDWRGRLVKLLDLLEGGGNADALALIDQLIAELLDGPSAISEVMGGLREGTETCGHLTALATGSGRLPKFASEAAHRLHAHMGQAALPVTQRILLDRVARILGSVKPLTQEGGEAERQAFTALVPTLLDPAGTLGGSATAEALTLRSKMALGRHEELSMGEAIEHLLDLFPNRAVRLGYLLDLMPTSTGQKNVVIIRRSLAQLIGQLKSVRHLMPEGTPPEALAAVIHALRARLAMETLPSEVRGALSSSLDRMVGVGPAAEGRGAAPAAPDVAAPSDLEAGQILFEEGDEGHAAYLISEGQVEIYRARGGREEVIATLGRGEVIGEMSLIDDLPRAASARTRPGTSLAVISQDDLQKHLAALESSDRQFKLLVDALIRRLRGQAKGPV